MSKLGWNEIRARALQFSTDWSEASYEKGEAQTFWNEFFNVFGIRRASVAAFEEPVKKLKGSYGFIDLFWKGKMLAEHKSKGSSLEKAESQAFQYIQDLMTAERADEVPRYIVVSDFARIKLYDLEPEDQGELFKGVEFNYIEFPLADLHKHVKHFGFITGQRTHHFEEEDPANIRAAELMADLHDIIEFGKYPPADLERLLVRILFCLFADDTGIFESGQFQLYIENKTKEDGSDLGAHLSQIFDILDTPTDERQANLDEDLGEFPYVNGELFAGHLRPVAFDRDMRNRLLAACRFDWAKISPAIFGSLFQGIMDAKERRQIGAHYTSERDILKLIRPLFLDELHDEFEQIKKDRSQRRRKRMEAFREKLTKLNFLDPACGCGNFLVIAYRELRLLEIDVLKDLYNLESTKQMFSGGELAALARVDVNQFYGIEISEWPARIAETALWLTDHQMNIELSEATGNLFQRIPLKAAPHIKCANALRMDWNELLPAENCSYILGNPPFIGKKEQDTEQKIDHSAIWGKTKGAGILDYVTCWYVCAGEYVNKYNIRCAFVSTNSISQGEQVGVLWSRLYSDFGFHILFAHTTFSWQSEARGAAHVHVIIMGFSTQNCDNKIIFDYSSPKADPVSIKVENINPYLTNAPNVIIRTRTRQISNAPPMNYGSMMIDKARGSGPECGLVLDDEERDRILQESPEMAPFIRMMYGGDEYINGDYRWCLWMVDAPPGLINTCKRVRNRIRGVRDFRLSSSRKATNKLAERPSLFGEIRQPDTQYLLVPKVSSETRRYVPIGFVSPSIIASGSALMVPGASIHEFGVLSSSMHMAWLSYVGGRMKSDYQYSSNIVYNNFPWPKPDDAQRAKVEACAQGVLDARQPHLEGGATLANLYGPLTMPPDLLKAHQDLDRAVDRCYRKEKFNSERERVEHLFRLYEQLTAPLAVAAPKKKRRARKAQ